MIRKFYPNYNSLTKVISNYAKKPKRTLKKVKYDSIQKR